MYSKEREKQKEEKKYVFNRSFQASKGGKTPRNVKMVDGRMKKDLRNAKFRARKQKKKGMR